MRTIKINRNPKIYKYRRTINFVKQFQNIATQDKAFALIPDLLIDLADKHGGYVFDLQPDNFRLNAKNEVILVDPSVPNLVGDIHNPDDLFYEDKLNLVLSIDRLLYE